MKTCVFILFPAAVGSFVGWLLYNLFSGYAAMFQQLAAKL